MLCTLCVHFVNSCGEREEDISEDDDDDVLGCDAV
jgi:hypothetical protein